MANLPLAHSPAPFVVLVLAAALGLGTFGLGACQRDAGDAGRASEAASPAAKACPGATAAEAEAEYHPRILRGRVLAPHGKLASRRIVPDWLLASAQAAPLEGERAVAEARVELYQVGPSGEPKGEVLRETATNANGEWCLKLPDGVDFGADLMLESRAGAGAHLRRSVVSQVSTDLYSTAEALTRLLIDRDVDFTKIPGETYLNMESIADTRVDLLEGMTLADGDTVTSTVSRIEKVLAEDERLIEKIDALAKR